MNQSNAGPSRMVSFFLNEMFKFKYNNFNHVSEKIKRGPLQTQVRNPDRLSTNHSIDPAG